MKSVVVDMDQAFSFWVEPEQTTKRYSSLRIIQDRKAVVRVSDEWLTNYNRVSAEYSALHSQVEDMYRAQEGIEEMTGSLSDVSVEHVSGDAPFSKLKNLLTSEMIAALDIHNVDSCTNVRTIIGSIVKQTDYKQLNQLADVVRECSRTHPSYACLHTAIKLADYIALVRSLNHQIPTIQMRALVRDAVPNLWAALAAYNHIRGRSAAIPIPMSVKRGLADALAQFSIEAVREVYQHSLSNSMGEMYQYLHPSAKTISQRTMFNSIVAGTVTVTQSNTDPLIT